MDSASLNPIDVHVGEKVKLRRLALGLSQERLAEAINVSYQQVQKYEKGKNQLSATRIAQFAAILQVAPGWFFEGAPAPTLVEALAA